MFQIADCLAEAGHPVVIKHSNLRLPQHRYFSTENVNDYHPTDNLNPRMFEEVRDDVYYWTIFKLMTEGDIDVAFFGRERWAYLANHVKKPVFLYSHWPERPIPPKATILCNSGFTKREINRRWGVNAIVLNPPVYLDRYDPERDFDERDIDVISVGQFYHYKGFEILDELEGFNVHLVGTKVPDSKVPNRATIHEGVKFSELSELLSRAKVFVHPTWHEHFGIVVVEAMASGCPVVVHKSGGPWFNVVRGRYGLGFEGAKELRKKVSSLMDKKRWTRYKILSLERSMNYGKGRFKEKLGEVLNGVRTNH